MGIETLGQQSAATTPTFSGAPIPGVPGQPQAQTAADPNQKAQQILATILQAAQRKQAANTAVPMNIPPQEDPNAARQIGMNTANPRGWGLERLSAGIATNIKNAVAKQKQDQLLKAEGDWTYLQSALNEKFTAEQSGDQKGVQAAEAKLQAILGDPKKLKNMSKALNQDWLNPEKTTVYGEALKKVSANQKQQDQQNAQKQTVAQKLKSAVMGLLKQKQELQLTVDEQKRMAQEIEGKAPTTQGQVDPKTMLELQRVLGEEQYRKADIDLRTKELEEKKQEREDALKEKKQEHIDSLQIQRDKLNEQMKEKQAALEEKKLEAKDRQTTQSELLQLRRDALAQQKEIAEEKLNIAGTPKERQTWVNNELKELMKARDDAQKNMHLWGSIGGDEFNEAGDRVQRLQAMSDQVVAGKITTEDAISKIYGDAAASGEPARPAGTPENYQYKADGPKGAGWYKPTPTSRGLQ